MLDISPDGRYICAFDGNRERHDKQDCRVWDSVTGKLVLHRPTPVWEHAFRPDGKVLALVQADGSVALCDLDTRRDLALVPAGLAPTGMRFDPSGRYLAVSSRANHDLEIWDAAPETLVNRLLDNHGGGAILAWSPDGSLVLIWSPDNSAHLCTYPGGNTRAVLRGHEHIITSAAFHPSGRLLASTSHDDTTRLWCFSPGGELIISGEKLLGFSPDGRRLTTASSEGITDWEVTDPGDCLHYLAFDQSAGWNLCGVNFAPDGRLLGSASQEGVLLWDTATACRIGRLPSGESYALAFSADGRHLFTSGRGGLLHWPIVPVREGRPVRIGPSAVLRPTTAASQSLRIGVGDTGGQVLMGAGDGSVTLVPFTNPGHMSRLGTHDGLSGVALSPDGRWAISAGGLGDAVWIWDVYRGALARRLPHGGEYCGATFSPDGRRLVTGARSEFCFWEVGSWQLQARLPRDSRSLFSLVSFTRDGRMLALAQGRNRIRLHDAATLRALGTLEIPGPANVTGLSLSPDGTRLAAATGSNVIALWDLRRLREKLAALDMDWEMPPYPPAEYKNQTVEPLRMEFLPADKAPR
jgi:WD40 repeat protein